MNHCKCCGIETTNPKFCSSSCSAKVTNKQKKARSAISKNKTSTAIQAANTLRKQTTGRGIGPAPRSKVFFPTCKVCAKQFVSRDIPRKTCSNECRDSIRSQNGTLKKRIRWNGFIFQSSWEVEIAKFLTASNVTWTQPHKRIKWFDATLSKYRTYLPDFYLPNTDYYLDVKNPLKQEQDKDKLHQLKQIMRLYVGDIKEVKNFVAGTEGLEPPTI